MDAAIFSDGSNGVLVHPRFPSPDTNIAYEIEVDRLGFKEEIFEESEDASEQFLARQRITADIQNQPIATTTGTTITLSVTSNLPNTTFVWDLDQDGVYEESGSSVSYTAPVVPGVYVVYMIATSPDAQTIRRAANITVA